MDSDVYCNLHKRCTSVKALKGPQAGRVVAQPKQVVVRDVRFRVLPGGRERAIRDHVRNVHAYARGVVDMEASITPVQDDPRVRRLHYNPFRAGTFTDDAGQPVHTASVLAIDGKTAYFIP